MRTDERTGDDEPVAELAALIPDADARFSDEVMERVRVGALGGHIASAAGWMVTAAVLQMFAGFFSLTGLDPDTLEGDEK